MKKVRPKKHLGQHFLQDENIARKIVDALGTPEIPVIEVGPGMGVLTRHLLKVHDFRAYDIDQQSINYLSETYPDHAHKFHCDDILKIHVAPAKYSVIGNFPYNISSQIFFMVYEDRSRIDMVVGMVQKEVADRIVSKEGSKVYGILSVLLQTFFDIEYLFTVKPGSFFPPPRVNSAVLRLRRNARKSLPCDEDLFKKVVKMGFGKRRKTLRNALKELNLPGAQVSSDLLSKRAEQLSTDDFIMLTQMIEQDG